MLSMSTLMDQVTGQFRIRTQSGSTYLLDLDRHQMCRIPATNDPERDHNLRRDGSTVRLLGIAECTVGRPMHLLIDLAIAGVEATIRRSTPVTAIERVSANQLTGRNATSPIVTIEPVRAARELSAAEIETVQFVGDYINYGVIPQIRIEP